MCSKLLFRALGRQLGNRCLQCGPELLNLRRLCRGQLSLIVHAIVGAEMRVRVLVSVRVSCSRHVLRQLLAELVPATFLDEQLASIASPAAHPAAIEANAQLPPGVEPCFRRDNILAWLQVTAEVRLQVHGSSDDALLHACIDTTGGRPRRSAFCGRRGVALGRRVAVRRRLRRHDRLQDLQERPDHAISACPAAVEAHSLFALLCSSRLKDVDDLPGVEHAELRRLHFLTSAHDRIR